MSQLDANSDIASVARATLPKRSDGEPLFRLAWHARVFALMVALVDEKRIPWKAFQERLVSKLKTQQSDVAHLCPEDIDMQYFDCWLEAAEQTLLEEGIVGPDDIGKQIELIRATVSEIREGQLFGGGHVH